MFAVGPAVRTTHGRTVTDLPYLYFCRFNTYAARVVFRAWVGSASRNISRAKFAFAFREARVSTSRGVDAGGARGEPMDHSASTANEDRLRRRMGRRGDLMAMLGYE